MEPIVGIDLGTTNSEIAFIFSGQAEIIRDGDDGIMPSCVALDNDGRMIVGQEARNQALLAPERTVLSVKRLMGTDRRISLNDQSFSPQAISAFILKALHARAEKALGRPIRKAVITVPAYFTDAQRQATREAGDIAGLDVVRIINEPTAAALAYESPQGHAHKIMVYDLGGGTFDVSIVSIENGVVEVLASTGDNHLGGDDFDRKIVDRLVLHIESELGVPVRNNLLVMARLRDAAERAKIALSEAPLAMIEEDHIGHTGGRDVHLSYELSRRDFQQMIADDLLRTMDAVTHAMEDAAILSTDISKIILVGGSTRIPRISELLEQKLGLQPHAEIDPDLCVALGAAIQAGREMGLPTANLLVDITPYTFGTSAVRTRNGILFSEQQFVPLIRRNTKLPAKRSELFETLTDNQKQAEIKIYQGENAYAPDNILIGSYIFDLTQAPAGAPIIIEFGLDLNGILRIEAREKATDRSIRATIENAVSQFSRNELEDARDKVSQMWLNPKPACPASTSELPPETAALLERARARLDTAPPEDRDEIAQLIEEIRQAVLEQRTDKLEDCQNDLEEILFYLE